MPAEEIEKFDAALAKTVKDIEGVKERAAKRLKEEELAVFDAHLMMANDPELASQIKAMIEAESCNAEYATDTVANSMVAMFEVWIMTISVKELPMLRTLLSV